MEGKCFDCAGTGTVLYGTSATDAYKEHGSRCVHEFRWERVSYENGENKHIENCKTCKGTGKRDTSHYLKINKTLIEENIKTFIALSEEVKDPEGIFESDYLKKFVKDMEYRIDMMCMRKPIEFIKAL